MDEGRIGDEGGRKKEEKEEMKLKAPKKASAHTFDSFAGHVAKEKCNSCV